MKTKIEVKNNKNNDFENSKKEILRVVKNASSAEDKKEGNYVFALLFALANIYYRKKRILFELKNNNSGISASAFLKEVKKIFSSVTESRKRELGFAFMDTWMVGFADINYPEPLASVLKKDQACPDYADDYAALMVLQEVVTDAIQTHASNINSFAWLITKTIDTTEKKENSLFLGIIKPFEDDFSSKEEYDTFDKNRHVYETLKETTRMVQRNKRLGKDFYDLEEDKDDVETTLAKSRRGCVISMSNSLYGRDMFYSDKRNKRFSFC